jgi:hypothetical protein
MRVAASSAVIEKAEAVVLLILDTYSVPNKTFSDLRNLMSSHAANPLRAFSEECRAELLPSISAEAEPHSTALNRSD